MLHQHIQNLIMNCQKDKFSLPDHVSYLNCAYMSPQLKAVEEVGIENLRGKNLPYSTSAEDFFSGTRQLAITFSKLVNNADPERIAIIPSVSYGMAIVAANITLAPSDEVIVVNEQFPSNYYAWEKKTRESKASLISICGNEDNFGQSINEALLAKINEHTKLVSISHVHWADGTKFDLATIRKKTNAVGALLVIDGTQSVGALPFDISEIQPDALICAGYKWLMGPYGLGLAYFGPKFDGGIPIEENWINKLNSENFAGLVNYQSDYQPKARRFSMGEQSNFILVPMLQKAIEQIIAWGPKNIQSYCLDISSDAIDELQQLGLKIEPEGYRGHHLFGLRLPSEIDLQKLSEKFNKEQVYISIRGNAIRVAPHVYNHKEDLGKLVACVKACIGQ